MTIEDKTDEDFFVYKGIQQTVKGRVVNLFLEKLEVQDTSGESSDMNESENLDELFYFLYKTRSTTSCDRTTKIFD